MLATLQDTEGDNDAPFREAIGTVLNIMHSAAYVVCLLAGKMHTRIQALSGLLWGLTIVAILVQQFLMRTMVHKLKSEVQEVPLEGGISSLQAHIKQLDL